MLGYVIERQSKIKFLFIFYSGIITGHMLSCCLSSTKQLTVGTSCGTLAILPSEIKRFIILRKTNPEEAKPRAKFLVVCIFCNLGMNLLAILGIEDVDWISHIGCLITGLLLLIYY
jgi:membrane associated rhomboid family serine protease